MGNTETKQTDFNPLGIPEKYFQHAAMNEAKTAVMFQIGEKVVSTGSFPNTIYEYEVQILKPKSGFSVKFYPEFTRFELESGIYLCSKTEPCVRLNKHNNLRELLAKHKIKANSEKGYFEPLVEEKVEKTPEPKPEYKDEETQFEPIQCCVCALNKKCIFFEKCKHMPVCYSCSVKLNGKCPLCRMENQSTSVVYI